MLGGHTLTSKTLLWLLYFSKVLRVAMFHAWFFSYSFSKIFITFNSAFVGTVWYYSVYGVYGKVLTSVGLKRSTICYSG